MQSPRIRNLPLRMILTGMLASAGVSKAETEVFVYVEPREIRLEIVVQANLLSPPSNSEIDSSLRQQLLARWADELWNAIEIKADGKPVEFTLDESLFVLRDDHGVEPDERDVIPIEEAFIAVEMFAAHDRRPAELEAAWKFSALDFPDREIAVQFEAMVAAETIEFYQKQFSLNAESPVCVWSLPEAAADSDEPSSADGDAPSWSRTWILSSLILALALAFPFWLGGMKKTAIWIFLSIAVGLIGSDLAGFFKKEPAKEPGNLVLEKETQQLLQKIYKAFDFRDESRIYDTLSAQVEGDLLETIYLDIREALEVEEAGGPRVRIGKVQLVECAIEESGEGFKADARWIATGSVSHFGHRHPRRNSYHGLLSIEKRSGAWKLVELEILDEQRD